jgi:hypothetical protein
MIRRFQIAISLFSLLIDIMPFPWMSKSKKIPGKNVLPESTPIWVQAQCQASVAGADSEIVFGEWIRLHQFQAGSVQLGFTFPDAKGGFIGLNNFTYPQVGYNVNVAGFTLLSNNEASGNVIYRNFGTVFFSPPLIIKRIRLISFVTTVIQFSYLYSYLDDQKFY